MSIFKITFIIGIIYVLVSFGVWFTQRRKKQSADYAEPKGKTADGIKYSITNAMMPTHKESAYLHIPTYAAGMLFHAGIFLSILISLIMLVFPNLLFSDLENVGKGISNFFSNNLDVKIDRSKSMFITDYFDLWGIQEWIRMIAGAMLAVSFCCGFGLLIKRFISPTLKHISSVDDFISNILTTSFIAVTAYNMLFFPTSCANNALYIIASITLLYIPLGKLRHIFYFVFARIELGKFYGSRGVWPQKKN